MQMQYITYFFRWCSSFQALATVQGKDRTVPPYLYMYMKEICFCWYNASVTQKKSSLTKQELRAHK